MDAAAELLVGVPVGPGAGAEGAALDVDHLLDLDAVLVGELEVTLVVRRHAHHRAVAVAHQHVVAHPQRHGRAGQRVRHRQPGGQAFLVAQRQLGLGGAAGAALVDEGGQRRIALRGLRGQRVLRRHGAEGHAHDGVGAGGEDIHAPALDHFAVVAADVVREGKAHAFALADPVLLHQLDALGPARQVLVHMLEQLLGVLRDLQVVAGDLALFDDRAAAPAAAVDDLFVGQHGLVHRVPVDDLRAPLGDAGLQHLQEQPLVPLVVVRRTGGDLAAPVDGQAHGLHLALHVGDVVVGPLRRRHLVLHRRVLGRQPEGVPAHRHQHVQALHAQLAREHVVDGVVAHMPHVQLAAGVGQHRAGVELLARSRPRRRGRHRPRPSTSGLRLRPRRGCTFRSSHDCRRGYFAGAGVPASVTKPTRDRPASCTRPMSSATRP